MDKQQPSPESTSRREFVRKSAYLAPAILTLSGGIVRREGRFVQRDGRP